MNMAMMGLKAVLIVVGLIACFAVIFSAPAPDATKAEITEYANGGQMSMVMYYTLFVVFAALALVLLFFVLQLVMSPKKTVMSIIGIIAAFLLFLIIKFAGTADTNESLLLDEKVHVSDGTLASTTAGIWTVIIVSAVGFLSWFILPLYVRFRK